MSKPAAKRKRRDARPRRIIIGGKELTRNDVKAEEFGCSERSLDRLDAQGAAYMYVAGVKYRPPEFNDFMLGRIQRRNPPRAARRSR